VKKFIVFIFIIIVCVGLFACEKTEQLDDDEPFVAEYLPFTVMSFNIRIVGLEDREDKFWDNRKEDVAALIFRHSPDIIGFQEVKDPQFEYLKEQLADYECYGVNAWTGSEFSLMMGGANAVFYKRDRFEALSATTLWQSDTPTVERSHWEDVDIRTLTKLELKDKLSGEVFTFINTHLSVKQLGQNKATLMLAEIARETEGGLIITGDFNYQKDTADYNIITNDSLADAMVLAPSSDSGGTFHSFNGTLDKPWAKPIDFIFLTDTYFTPLSYKIVRDSNDKGWYPSDHYPIKTVVEYVVNDDD